MLVNLAVVLVIVPYIYAAVAIVKVIYDLGLPIETRRKYKWIALVAVIYCLWVLLGGDKPTIVYAFMQAVGMVNDHLVSCYRHPTSTKHAGPR